jgi:IS605 OrfB family transposase
MGNATNSEFVERAAIYAAWVRSLVVISIARSSTRILLKICVPDRLLAAGDAKYLVIDNVTFGYDRDALDAAIVAGIALSWRLHRDERRWRAFVSFNHTQAERTTFNAGYGTVGIDFNVDHRAVTETDAFGNPLLREDSSSGQCNPSLSDALQVAIAWAKEVRKPIVAEDLDFNAKKKAIAQLSAKGARMLSGLLYAKYRQLLEAKCARAGVESIRINPAYTSAIGAMTYVSRRGWSVHAAAVGVSPVAGRS